MTERVRIPIRTSHDIAGSYEYTPSKKAYSAFKLSNIQATEVWRMVLVALTSTRAHVRAYKHNGKTGKVVDGRIRQLTLHVLVLVPL